MITAVSIICTVYMFFILGFTLAKLFATPAKERMKFFKNFKKGNFALIYLSSIPLYAIAFSQAGYNAGGAFLKSVRSTIELIVLKFDYDSVKELMSQNVAFRTAMILCFTLVTLNAAVFTFSLFGRSVTNTARLAYIRLFSKKVVVVVGNNKDNFRIVDSVKSRDTRVILMGTPDDNGKNEMFAPRRAFVALKPSDNVADKLKALLPNLKKMKTTVIVNTGDDSSNLTFCRELCNLINAKGFNDLVYDAFESIEVFAFCSPENQTAFDYIEEHSGGRVHHVNKYEMIATDFVAKYPATRFMNEEQIDYDKAAIRRDVEFNDVFIGFGKTNQRLFLSSVSNDTLMQEDEKGNYVLKPVNYFIFDIADADNERNLNHAYFRFAKDYSRLLASQADYLPLPPLPSNYKFTKIDVNSARFYDEIRECLCNGKKSFGYLTIAYGSDMQNLDLALKLSEKIREWAFDFPVRIFVKIRDAKLNSEVASGESFKDHALIPFGNEKALVYDVEKITNRFFESMAKTSHLLYSATDNLIKNPESSENDLKTQASKKWYSFNNYQRNSNVYACIALRLKLNLCGYDLTRDPAAKDASEDFYRKYQQGNPVIRNEKLSFMGNSAIIYDNASLDKDGLRKRLGDQEHCRWNAQKCASGFIPATIGEMSSMSNAELMKLRKHPNITTREGLVLYRKLKAKQTNSSEEDTDVIRYDCRLADDVLWLTRQSGLKIVEKNN